MRKICYFLFVSVFAILSCGSSTNNFEQIQKKVYSNTFQFVTIPFENKKSYSAPAGTGRILTTNTPSQNEEVVGIQVSTDRLIINLPASSTEATVNKYSVNVTSENFTVARKELEGGNILVNYFLNDRKDINLVKMVIQKNGQIDCSVEGPQQKPLLYTGYLK